MSFNNKEFCYTIMEYRMSQGNKVLMYVLAAGMAGFALFLLNSTAHWHSGMSWPGTMLLVIPLLAGAVFLVLESINLRVVIDDQSLTVTHAFSSREVLLDEIAGYRKGSKGAFWLDLKSGQRRVSIPTTTENRDELLGQLKEKYPDIDAERAQQITKEVLEDERFGSTEEERGKRLAMARRLMIYSAATPLLLIWVIINPKPWQLLMLIVLGIPLVCGWLTWYYKGILRIYISNARPYPTLLMGILAAEFVGLIALMRVYKVYEFGAHFWLLLLGCSVVVTMVWVVACRAALAGENNVFAVYLAMLLLAGAYSAEALVFVNCTYDRGVAEVWRVGIDRKHAQHGKSTSYWLELSPWGRYDLGKSVSVEYPFYRSVAEGDTVKVLIHPGKCGIPWYEVTK